MPSDPVSPNEEDLIRVDLQGDYRWKMELLFREWKSFAHLMAFNTAKAHIAEGMVWAAIATSMLQRMVAHMGRWLFETKHISSEITAQILRSELTFLLRTYLRGGDWKTQLLELLQFVDEFGRRPNYDRVIRHAKLAPG